MKRIFGPLSASPVECTNPVRDTWRARWDYRTNPDSGATSYVEEEYDHQPTPAEVAASHRSWVNTQVDERILSGFSFEGASVWLSTENQLNYTAAFQLATSTGGSSLPVTLKFGADDSPVFRTFSSLEDITAFYRAMQQHISSAVAWGWEQKGLFDTSPYIP